MRTERPNSMDDCEWRLIEADLRQMKEQVLYGEDRQIDINIKLRQLEFRIASMDHFSMMKFFSLIRCIFAEDILTVKQFVSDPNRLEIIKDKLCMGARNGLLENVSSELLKALLQVDFVTRNSVRGKLRELLRGFLTFTRRTATETLPIETVHHSRSLLKRSLFLNFDVHDDRARAVQLAQCVIEWDDWSEKQTQFVLNTANCVNIDLRLLFRDFRNSSIKVNGMLGLTYLYFTRPTLFISCLIGSIGVHTASQYLLLNSVIEFTRTAILALHDPVLISQSFEWPETISLLLSNRAIMSECMSLLDHDTEKFMDIICRCRGVLFNKFTSCWIQTLLDHLTTADPLIEEEFIGKLREAILNARQNGQTIWFDMRGGSSLLNIFNDKSELLQILSIRDHQGNTALHVNRQIFPLLLEFYRRHALENSQFNKLFTIQNDLQQRPIDSCPKKSWLLRQIASNNYALYHKPELLILYNTVDREGAEQEAQRVISTFESHGFEPRVNKNLSKSDIHDCIRESAMRTQSALIVVIMTHGIVGSVTDKSGELIKLSEIEMSMRQTQHPKLLITQCCQIDDNTAHGDDQSEKFRACTNSNDPGGRTAVSRPVFSPRHDDVCVIESCVQGQYSKRDLFIRILSDYLRQLSVDESITDLFEKTTLKMKDEGSDQIPVIKTTMRRKLCLKNLYQK